MSGRRLISLSGPLFVAALFSSTISAAEWTVPAASHAPGAANTNWRTDLRLVNPAASAADVRLDLLPQNTDNSALSHSSTVHVPAHGQLSVSDVLASQFTYSGNAALRVSSSEASLVVTSRTYNQAQSGATYGQFIPGVPSAQALAPGASGNLIYVTKTSDYRTNIGFAGTTAAAGKVTVKLLDASGFQLGTGVFDVQAYGQGQINDVFAATGSAATAVARAVVTTTVPVVAYASIIDNRTGDPIAMIAVPDSDASNLLAIPGIGHLPGAANSLWRSDVRIFHPGQGGSIPVVLTYYPGNTANPVLVTKTVTIASNQVIALDDLLLTTFGISNGSGALRVQSDGKLLVTSRTYNQSSTGTFGQDIPAIAYDRAFSASATALFSGLSDSGYRTNVGFFNLSQTPLDLTLTLKNPDGTVIATKPYHLDANMMSQTNLFALMGAGGTASASLSATGSGSGTYWAYASVIDNASGDPVFVPAVLSTATAGGGNPGSDCVNIPYMRVGLVLGYRTSDGSYTSTQTVNADGASQTILHDHATAGGYPEDIDSTFTYVTQGELRVATHLLSSATVSAGGFSIVANTDITWSPGLVIGPVSQFCSGATFPIAATTQTVAISGTAPGPTTVTNRAATTGEIQAVRESLTTAAGTFSTVKLKSAQGTTGNGVAYSLGWYDIASGVLVRQQQFGSGGNLIQTLDLTSMQ